MNFLIMALLALAGFNSNAQTIDEIVNKHIEAMGGKEKLAALKTVRMTGSMSIQGMDINMVITKSHMKGLRNDIEFNGSSYYQFANTTKGQSLMPPMTEAEEMDAETFKNTLNQMDVQGALFNYKEKGSTLELVGSEKVNGADAYNIKVTYKNGKTTNYFIDKTTSRLVKTSGIVTMQGQEIPVETNFTDYKQNSDGYWFPYTITSVRGPITLTKIETNIPVDDKIFSN